MRARNIKPSLFKNEVLGTADPLLTILFEGLWCVADRHGRLEDRPLRIKAEVFPYRENLDIDGYLTELARLRFIHRYTVDGKRYIQVITFDEHQNPHHTEKSRDYPPPPLEINGLPEAANDPVYEPLENGCNLADSLNHESCIYDSKKKEGQQLRNRYRETGKRVIKFLNEKAERNYQASGVNLDFVIARLQDGATEDQLRQIIAMKSREWKGDETMNKYLRPKTLFNRTNLAQYIGELKVDG